MHPVLIVGAGPTGLTLAAVLARHGAPFRIIDQATTPPDDRSRAVVVQSRTLELFRDLGIVDQAFAAGLVADSANVYASDGRHGTLRIDTSRVESPYPGFLTLPQDETERILVELLASQGVAVERGVRLVGIEEGESGATAMLRHPEGGAERLPASYIVGADGAHSAVRQFIGLPFDGITYADECMLGDVIVDWTLPTGQLSICPHPDGVLLAFPLPGDRHFRVIMILPRDSASEERHLSLEEFTAQLGRMMPGHTAPVIREANWLTRYRLHRRGVPGYRKRHCFVAGDAAHIHSPVGAQGMNTGIQDAYNLGWKLALVMLGRAPESLLDSYDGERRHVGEILLKGTDRAFALIARRGFFSRMVRRVAPNLALQLIATSAVGSRVARFISQTGIHYRRSALSVEGTHASELGSRSPRAGDRAPDASLLDHGGATSLFDLLRGPHFSLLCFGALTSQLDDLLTRQFPEVKTFHLGAEDAAASARYGASNSALFLVRPDGHIAFRGTMADLPELMKYLERIFTT